MVGVVMPLQGHCLSRMSIILGDLMKRPSGPRDPVPLMLCSYVNSKIGLLMCFLCEILLSAVVTVCLVPDIATRVLSKYAFSISGFVFFFFHVKNE